MQRRHMLRILGGGAITAALPPLSGCSSDLPEDAIAAWRGPAAGVDLRRWVLAHAILAPHSHNLQSWLVDLREPGVITLRIDRTRLLPETDPYSRQMTMSQGTFLELLDQAARQRGHRAVLEPFPQGEWGPAGPDDRPSARVQLVADASVQPDPLFAQVFRRHTNRASYDGRPIDPAAVQALRDSVAGYPVQLGITGASDTAALQAHRDIALRAWRIELTTPRTLLESYRVLRVGPREIASHRDGLSINAPMVRAMVALGLFDRSQPSAPDSAAIRSQIDTFHESLQSTPAFFWLTSADNSRRTQLAAGRAYVRAQLAATAQGLSMHPLQQALQEYPEQAVPYAEIRSLLGASQPAQTVQMWARLGRGPAIGPAPRRGVQAHVVA